MCLYMKGRQGRPGDLWALGEPGQKEPGCWVPMHFEEGSFLPGPWLAAWSHTRTPSGTLRPPQTHPPREETAHRPSSLHAPAASRAPGTVPSAGLSALGELTVSLA